MRDYIYIKKKNIDQQEGIEKKERKKVYKLPLRRRHCLPFRSAGSPRESNTPRIMVLQMVPQKKVRTEEAISVI